MEPAQPRVRAGSDNVVGEEFVVVLAICTGFCALSVFAILAFVVGERSRRLQRLDVAEYVVRRLDALKRRRDEERTRDAESARRQQQKKDVVVAEIPEDKALDECLKFVQKVAKEAPQVMALAMRSYVASDPKAAQKLEERKAREGEKKGLRASRANAG